MSITLINRQRGVRIGLFRLREFANRALIECLKLRKSRPLSLLPEISVVFISDKRIAKIHQQFMNEPGPTDVITFQHGEIFVSPETAKRQSRQFGTSLEHELRLYIVHGLLHLSGFDDKTLAESREMKLVQERIVTSCSGDR